MDDEQYQKVRQLVERYEWDKLLKLGTPAVKPLLFMLRIKAFFWTIRCEIMRVLSEIGDSRAVEPLIRIMEYKCYGDPEGKAAARALAKIGGKRAIDSLI